MSLRGIVILFLIFQTLQNFGQGTSNNFSSRKKWLPLKIGDKLPNIMLEKFIKNKSNKISLYDIKSKITIVDFWATWCTPCMIGIDKLTKIKEDLENGILEVILVNQVQTGDKKDMILNFFEKREARTGIKTPPFPILYEDTVLVRLLPHRVIPHYVWLDSEKNIIAITSDIEISREKIISAASGKVNVRNKVKEKGWLTVEEVDDLFNKNNGKGIIIQSDYKVNSFVSKYKDGYSGEVVTKLENGVGTGVAMFNVNLIDLITRAYYAELRNIPRNRWCFDSKNPLKFRTNYQDSLFYEFTYCYGIQLPLELDEYKYKIMQTDLLKAFDISVTIKVKTMKCWVISAIDTTIMKKQSDLENQIDLDPETLKKKIYNTSLKKVLEIYNSILTVPLICSAKISNDIRVCIDMPYDLENQEGLLNSLRNAGLTIKEDMFELETAIISDNSN